MEAAFIARNFLFLLMKNILLALGAILTLTSCAGVRVQETQIATGATNPRAIYIRPFAVTDSVWKGNHHGKGESPIRKSLAPAEFSQALKHELEKLAPTMVLAEDESAPEGWIVEGSLDVVDAGHPAWRGIGGPVNPLSLGRSHVKIHVRISDARGHATGRDSKDLSKGGDGTVLYEFDLNGGSRSSGGLGSITAPGLGYATPFDYKNAAERVMMALSIDPHGYGDRTSPAIR